MKNVIGKGLSALILSSGLILLPVSAQNGDPENPHFPDKSPESKDWQSESQAAKSANSGSLSASDRQFVQKAAEANKAEVELGQLAMKNGSSQDVKQFGQRMVDDHSKANQELQQIASQKGVSVPDQLSAKDEAAKSRLEKLSGKQFDQAYMQDMVTDHTKDVSEFQRESGKAKDPDVKSYAQKTLPTLQDHLKMAMQIEPKTTIGSNPK